jgi:hypothetical protein
MVETSNGRAFQFSCVECGQTVLTGHKDGSMFRQPDRRLCRNCSIGDGVSYFPEDITEDGIPDDMVVESLDEDGLADFLLTEDEPEYGLEAVPDEVNTQRRIDE